MVQPVDVARLMAVDETRRRGSDVYAPAGYIKTRTSQLLDEHGATWRALLKGEPGLSAEQLIEAITPRHRDPREGAQKASFARIARNQRVAAGDACATCGDSGWVLDESGVARPCGCDDPGQ